MASLIYINYVLSLITDDFILHVLLVNLYTMIDQFFREIRFYIRYNTIL